MKFINDNILTIVVFLPLAGAILLAFFPRRDRGISFAAKAVFNTKRTCPGFPIPTFTTTWAWMASRCGW